MERSDDHDGPKRVLQDAFGERSVTWIEISEIFPECTDEAIRQFLHGPRGSVDPRTSEVIAACLQWRPYLRWEHDYPTTDGEIRVRCNRYVARGDDGQVFAIECIPVAGRGHHRVVRFERIEDEAEPMFAITVTGFGDGDDVELVIDHQLLPILDPVEPTEWARVPESWLKPLLEERSPSIEIGTTRAIRHVAERRRKQHGVLRRIRDELPSHLLTAVIVLLLLGSFMLYAVNREVSKAEDRLVAEANQVFEQRISEALPQYSDAEANIRFARGPGGYQLVSHVPSREQMSDTILVGQRLTPLGPLIAPESLGAWTIPEPNPVTTQVKVADVLAENPGQELIILRRHRMRALAVLEIRDLNMRVLRQVFNRGYLYDVEVGKDGLLAVIGAANHVPLTVPELSEWERFAMETSRGHRYPNALAVFDPEALPRRSVLFPAQSTQSFPRAPLRHFFVQPASHSNEQVTLSRLRPTHDDAVATATFRYQGRGELETLVASIDEQGRLTRWRAEDGTPLDFQVEDLVPVDVRAWGSAIDAVVSVPDASPVEAADTLRQETPQGAAGDRAIEVAQLRSRSVLWRLGIGYEVVSDPRRSQEDYQQILDDVRSLEEDADRPWSVSLHRRRAVTLVLALHRLGRGTQAADALLDFPMGEPGEDPSAFELMAAGALVFAELGRLDEAEAMLNTFTKHLDGLPDHRRWHVMCDTRTRRVLEEAKAAIERLRAQLGSTTGASWRPGDQNLHRPRI